MEIAGKQTQRKQKVRRASKPKNPPKIENPDKLKHDLENQLRLLNQKISEFSPSSWKCYTPENKAQTPFKVTQVGWVTCSPQERAPTKELTDLLDQKKNLLGDLELLKALTPEALKTRVVADPIEQFLRKQYVLSASPRTCALWARVIRYEAKRAGMDPKLVLAFIHQESGFNGNAVSQDGYDHGPMQLRDDDHSTMEEIARLTGLAWTRKMLKSDPIANIRGGVRYLGALGRQFDGDAKLATLSYNAGAGNTNGVLSDAGIANAARSAKKPNKLRKIADSKKLIDRLIKAKAFRNNDYLTSVYATYSQYKKTIPDWKKAPAPVSFKIASNQFDDSDEPDEAIG